MEVGSFNTKASLTNEKAAVLKGNRTASRNVEDEGLYEAHTYGQGNETVASIVGSLASAATSGARAMRNGYIESPKKSSSFSQNFKRGTSGVHRKQLK